MTLETIKKWLLENNFSTLTHSPYHLLGYDEYKWMLIVGIAICVWLLLWSIFNQTYHSKKRIKYHETKTTSIWIFWVNIIVSILIGFGIYVFVNASINIRVIDLKPMQEVFSKHHIFFSLFEKEDLYPLIAKFSYYSLPDDVFYFENESVSMLYYYPKHNYSLIKILFITLNVFYLINMIIVSGLLIKDKILFDNMLFYKKQMLIQ